jgi:GMP synthase PP-ATPase subunit
VQQAEDAGKITADQATKIDNFWVAHHKQFAWNFVLRRLLRAQNESNVKTYLDKAVANNKITVDQENKVLAIWEIIYSPAPTSTAPAATTTTTTAP